MTLRRSHVTTTEAAQLLGVDPRSFPRYARRHNLEPVRRLRVGSSTVTLWSVAALIALSGRHAPADAA